MVSRTSWGVILIEPMGLCIHVNAVLHPERFKRLVRKSLKWHATSVAADPSLFAANLIGTIRRETGGQTTSCVRVDTTPPENWQHWTYRITSGFPARLSVSLGEENEYLGTFFAFTKRLSKFIRGTRVPTRRKRARDNPNAHRYERVPDFVPSAPAERITGSPAAPSRRKLSGQSHAKRRK